MEDVIHDGQELDVKVLGRDSRGNIQISRKATMRMPAAAGAAASGGGGGGDEEITGDGDENLAGRDSGSVAEWKMTAGSVDLPGTRPPAFVDRSGEDPRKFVRGPRGGDEWGGRDSREGRDGRRPPPRNESYNRGRAGR